MGNNVKQKVVASGKSRPLTPEEKKELKDRALKRVKSLLESLDAWRCESLSSSFRF